MQREQAQILRQQQDQAYLDSLKADQEKVKDHEQQNQLLLQKFSKIFELWHFLSASTAEAKMLD